VSDLVDARAAAIETPPTSPARRQLPRGLLFALVALLCTVTFGPPIALIARGALASATPEIEATAASAAPAARTASPAPVPVRVVSTSGNAEPGGSGVYRVTFTWTLEGAREGDIASVRFGTAAISEQRGTLDPSVFTQSTGVLTLTSSQECSVDGWAAELVSVRGLAPVGERVARVAGVPCG
jgi:hypothetical protein